MPFTTCPHCKQQIKFDAEDIGLTTTCPYCSVDFELRAKKKAKKIVINKKPEQDHNNEDLLPFTDMKTYIMGGVAVGIVILSKGFFRSTGSTPTTSPPGNRNRSTQSFTDYLSTDFLDSEAFIVALLMGMMCGAIPLIVGAIKGRISSFLLGVLGFVFCAIAGILGGLIFAIPVCGIMTFIVCFKRA